MRGPCTAPIHTERMLEGNPLGRDDARRVHRRRSRSGATRPRRRGQGLQVGGGNKDRRGRERPRQLDEARLPGPLRAAAPSRPWRCPADGGGEAHRRRRVAYPNDADGERATDVASRRGHRSLAAALAPDLKRNVPAQTLAAIEACFHEVILGRASDLVREARLRLPCLAPLLKYEEAKCWCSIPGMYGGFSFWFDWTGAEARLVSESWCRVVGGSGQSTS